MGKEIERKFRIDAFPAAMPAAMEAEVWQGYLTFTPEVRIRALTPRDGTPRYTLTIKSEGGLERSEVELAIDHEQFAQLSALVPDRCHLVKQYKVYPLDNGLLLECSHVDPEEAGGFMYAEVEFPDLETAHQFIPPSFLGQEMTENREFKMKQYCLGKMAE